MHSPSSVASVCSLPLGGRVGERDLAFVPSAAAIHTSSPLASRPSPGQALTPRGEGNVC